jgi:hypothetical protein
VVAVRLRRDGYAQRFADQFTIRYHRASGAKTELDKIIEGFGDWMFYGHTDSTGLSAWMLVDLAVLRECSSASRRCWIGQMKELLGNVRIAMAPLSCGSMRQACRLKSSSTRKSRNAAYTQCPPKGCGLIVPS